MNDIGKFIGLFKSVGLDHEVDCSSEVMDYVFVHTPGESVTSVFMFTKDGMFYLHEMWY